MLKHVSYRSSSSLGRSCDFSFRSTSISPDKTINNNNNNNKDDIDTFSYFGRNVDNVSLGSTLSFSSLTVGGKLCSRTSSTISLSDQSTVPVKIYLHRLRSDMEYKTVSLSLQTTCKELVALLLNKFRLRHRDPNLFFVLMEITVRSPTDGAPVKRQLVLEDNARPAELQQCRPKGEANFSIGVRRGGLVRVHDSILMSGSHYKSLIVSYKTNADDLVKLLLNCYNSKEDAKYYCLHVTCKTTGLDRPLDADEFPIQEQVSWPRESKSSWAFVLRRNIKSLYAWRRSLEQSSTDSESETGDHDTTRASIMSSSSNSSSSSGVSSDSSSSSSSSSSSGRSSNDSAISSPRDSPSDQKHFSSSVSSPPLSPSSAVASKPPRPVPRTLFPSSKARTFIEEEEEEDSGIVMEDDFSVLKGDSDDEVKPEAIVRSSTISTSSISVRSSKYAKVKSLSRSLTKSFSKSTLDLKSLSASTGPHSKSTLNLSVSELVDSTPVDTSTPVATSTPKNLSERKPTPGRRSITLPLTKLRLSTSPSRDISCSCKSCFYI